MEKGNNQTGCHTSLTGSTTFAIQTTLVKEELQTQPLIVYSYNNTNEKENVFWGLW